jgi:L-lysine 2,3-aminomutase
MDFSYCCRDYISFNIKWIGMKTSLGKLMVKVSNLQRLSVLDLFQFLRYDYCQTHRSLLKKFIIIPNINFPTISTNKKQENELRRVIDLEKLDWGDPKFHLDCRCEKVDTLIKLKPELKSKAKSITEIVEKKQYLLSVLPLNLLLPYEVLNQFIPPSDFTDPHPTKDKDPYGIYLRGVRIFGKVGLPLGSHKFRNSILMDIQGWCPIGCSDCYKSYYTRERGHDLGVNHKTVKKQTKELVIWMNQNPEIYDVIISGGEPLTISNLELKTMLDEFKKAKFLKVLRICTGTIFLGLPFRIDEELLSIITEFCDDTGIRVTFNAHLSNHYQVTPEAIIAIQKIKKRGFKIYSQTPIKEGVNFFSDDLKKTIGLWIKLGETQLLCDVEPYKFIIDMHPQTLAYYVPIESVLKIWSIVYESHNCPELERPRTLSILCRQGNIILSGHTVFAMKKEVDKNRKVVKYYIPRVSSNNQKGFTQKVSFFTYREPLLEGKNDDPYSLEKLRKNWTVSVKGVNV